MREHGYWREKRRQNAFAQNAECNLEPTAMCPARLCVTQEYEKGQEFWTEEECADGENKRGKFKDMGNRPPKLGISSNVGERLEHVALIGDRCGGKEHQKPQGRREITHDAEQEMEPAWEREPLRENEAEMLEISLTPPSVAF